MAVLDRGRNVVVLRIVYDGPAGAGKTTSVRALGERLGRPCHTPEQAGERTLFFDWLDYTGGIFEGFQLRCQVVSVPGQAVLEKRREYLLGTADAVVYVSSLNEFDLADRVLALEALQAQLAAQGRGPIGVVLQANKRDRVDAAPTSAIREALSKLDLRVAIVESTATQGGGVREAFVFAVRLALDRVREQIQSGTLGEGAVDVDDPDTLVELMRANDVSLEEPGIAAALARPTQTAAPRQETDEKHEPSTAESALVEVARGERSAKEWSGTHERVTSDRTTAPLPPDQTVPSGLIWPPIEGRLCLAEATASPPRLSHGKEGWRASTERGWRFHSHFSAVFADPEEGRGALIRLARAHGSHAGLLSAPRCVVLASDGAKRWRLWQIVKEGKSLRERLAATLDEQVAVRVAELLVDTANRLIELDALIRCVSSSTLRVTLDTAGVVAGGTRYVGLIPDGAPPEAPSRLSIEQELGPILGDWSTRRGEVIVALRQLGLSAQAGEASVTQRLGRLLEG